ncbi:unnamed protein product [Haemonchus placei]|uniref:Transposase n=1 Tax=Haemonchus placei TaxID=6290 RepID=A0A0N4W071_HAEPC|nr:unnamed protein product [Haemonchus placei]
MIWAIDFDDDQRTMLNVITKVNSFFHSTLSWTDENFTSVFFRKN